MAKSSFEGSETRGGEPTGKKNCQCGLDIHSVLDILTMCCKYCSILINTLMFDAEFETLIIILAGHKLHD